MSQHEHAILQLMNEYCYRVDAGDFDGFASLFESGSFHVLGGDSKVARFPPT